ncbi:hypothetical protein PAPYR_784 [Paratrimastix pyriformis]|uniref:Uncharacterized protein n=1 Tax=Paratrimastix pyriformis TaxID=342808 RepID=A0ABQ8UUG8_9EUKA|nr:hypothetical protein PAPYR_784 [Paratrimastix pyriformis]
MAPAKSEERFVMNQKNRVWQKNDSSDHSILQQRDRELKNCERLVDRGDALSWQSGLQSRTQLAAAART